MAVILVGHKLDSSYQEIGSLKNAITEKDIQLDKLAGSINKKQFLIKQIEVFVQYEGDKYEKTALEKHIKDMFFTLLGKEVNAVDTDLILATLDKRLIRINEKEYTLSSQRIVLSDTLKIWVRVTPPH